MALAERVSEKAEGTDFSYLKYMKGVREALKARVTEAYGAFDLGRLEKATPEDQKSLVERAFGDARAEYGQQSNPSKLVQLKEVKEALSEGRLTLTELLEGLGLKAQQAGEGRHGGFFERIKSSLRKSIRS